MVDASAFSMPEPMVHRYIRDLQNFVCGVSGTPEMKPCSMVPWVVVSSGLQRTVGL